VCIPLIHPWPRVGYWLEVKNGCLLHKKNFAAFLAAIDLQILGARILGQPNS